MLFLSYMLFQFHNTVNAKVPYFPLFLDNKNNRVRVFTGSGLITGSDRIGPEIGLFLCLTDCFFFTRMMCMKDYVFNAICMHLYILILM